LYCRDDEVFGEETGYTSLSNVTGVRKMDDRSFEVICIDRKRQFRTPDAALCNEWVEAIKMAVEEKRKRGTPALSSAAGSPRFFGV